MKVNQNKMDTQNLVSKDFLKYPLVSRVITHQHSVQILHLQETTSENKNQGGVSSVRILALFL